VESAGYKAETFASARDFLAWLPHGHAGCLLLDVHMDGLSGFDLYDRLKVPIVFTAWRIRSEVLTLEWARVDVAEGCIRLDGTHSKNGKPRTAYLSADAMRLLAAHRERVVNLGRQLGRVIPDVFVDTDKGPLQGQRQREFNKAWRSACRRAEYTGTLLHDLRRSGVRAMVRSGTPESVCMKISGHTTAAIFKRYDIVSDSDLRDAATRRAQFGHSQVVKVVSIAR
jgi:integrase